VERFTDRDIATIVVRLHSGVAYFSSIYLNIVEQAQKLLFVELADFCNSEGIPLIGFDSNAHSTLWGAEEDNARGVHSSGDAVP